MANFLTRLFGSRNQRLLRQFSRAVSSINAMEAEIKALGDEALAAKTGEFRERLEKGADLDDLLPEAFAVAPRSRVANARHAALRRAAYWWHGIAPG